MTYPMGNFFSALAIVWRRSFSAFSLRVLMWMRLKPKALGVGGVTGEGIEDADETVDAADGLLPPSDTVESESDVKEADLLSDLVMLNNDLAGDIACGVDGFDASTIGMPGMLISLRTTIREMCRRFRASLADT